MTAIEIVLLLCILLAANVAIFTGVFCFVMVKDYKRVKDEKKETEHGSDKD